MGSVAEDRGLSFHGNSNDNRNHHSSIKRKSMIDIALLICSLRAWITIIGPSYSSNKHYSAQTLLEKQEP